MQAKASVIRLAAEELDFETPAVIAEFEIICNFHEALSSGGTIPSQEKHQSMKKLCTNPKVRIHGESSNSTVALTE